MTLGGSYLPGDQNSNEDGTARDVLGKEVKYRCMEAGCTLKRQARLTCCSFTRPFSKLY